MSAPHDPVAMLSAISREQPPGGAAAIWWLGQASFVIVAAGATIYVDPYLDPADRRLSPPAFPPESVTNADLVVLTHDHGDHVDPRSLPAIAKASPQARFVTPRPVVPRVAELVGGADRVTAAVADEPLAFVIGSGYVELLPVPAKHEEFDLTADGYPRLGFTIQVGGLAIHHPGDTIPYEGHAERVAAHRPDVVFVPINGRDFYRARRGTLGNMDYREAATFADAVAARVTIPMHYGMFAGNTVPVGHFVSYAAEAFPALNVHVMGRFGKFIYMG